jgi:hypothetical protein
MWRSPSRINGTRNVAARRLGRLAAISYMLRCQEIQSNAFRRAIPEGTSLATETRASAVGASRLKGGCSQDWLPH